MPTLISSAMANLESTIRGNVGIAGTLNRGGASTASVTAVIDTVAYELADDGSGLAISHVSVDLLIKPSDYLIGGAEVDPVRGDKWTYTDEFSVAHEYTVMFVSGQPVFTKEPHSHLMRIHTKET